MTYRVTIDREDAEAPGVYAKMMTYLASALKREAVFKRVPQVRGHPKTYVWEFEDDMEAKMFSIKFKL